MCLIKKHIPVKLFSYILLISSLQTGRSDVPKCDISEYPFMVSAHLVKSNSTQASAFGLLVTASWVLGSDRIKQICEMDEGANGQCLLLTGRSYYQPKSQDSDLSQVTSSRSYSTEVFSHLHAGLSMYKLQPPAALSSTTKPVKLPPRPSFARTCKKDMVVIGWISEPNETDEEQSLSCISVEPLQECAEPHRENEICIKQTNGDLFHEYHHKMLVVCNGSAVGILNSEGVDGDKIARVVEFSHYMTWIGEYVPTVPFQSNPPEIFDGLTESTPGPTPRSIVPNPTMDRGPPRESTTSSSDTSSTEHSDGAGDESTEWYYDSRRHVPGRARSVAFDHFLLLLVLTSVQFVM